LHATKIRIDEENIRLFWGLLIVLSLSSAIYLTGDIIWAQPLGAGNMQLILCLIFFVLSFYGIIQISRPLYHFNLLVDQRFLCIQIWKDEDTLLDTQKIPLDDITALRISPYSPRKANEALFDFSTNYHLLYRTVSRPNYLPLITLEGQSFTLKVEDIRKIMNFLCTQNPHITIPKDQTGYFLG